MSGRVVVAGGVALEQRVSWERAGGVRMGRPAGWSVGGTAALASVAAAAAGAVTRCVSVVGTDPVGGVLRQRLARADVDVTTVVPMPGLTGRLVRDLDPAAAPDPLAAPEEWAEEQLLLLPGATWGPGVVATEHALARCEPGDVLLLEWSALEATGDLVEAAYDLDLQIVALLTPYPLLPQALDLGRVDVAIVDQRGALHLADAGELPASLCVSVAGGLAWDDRTFVAPAPAVLSPARRHAVLAGALAARLACGDMPEEAAEAALAAVPGTAGPWRHLALDEEDLA